MQKPLIDLSQVKYRWPGSPGLTLNINDLKIFPGEKVFLYGPSGSGKTTLLGLIGGVLLAESGCVSIMGQNLSELSSKARDSFRADHVGFIFQQFNLIPYLNVLENVLLALSFSQRKRKSVGVPEREAYRLLESLGIPESLFKQKVSKLSVGQQQRVAAARALLGQPELLIADEPTSALDSEFRDQFIEVLESLCQKTNSTLVFVSHDHSLSRLFDRKIDLPSINMARLNPVSNNLGGKA